ncbi:MAG: glycosyltransferase family 4 protein [Lentisphaerae bacterium]|nr:glycosyltransferase family 4 protein [Lentisphaerota bacterium]
MEQVKVSGDSTRPPSCAGKVAFSVFKYYPCGGLQMEMLHLAEEFTARNIEVVIYCMVCESPVLPPGVSCRVIQAKGWSNHRKIKDFTGKLAKELAGENFLAHIAFNRVYPADWHYECELPFADGENLSFLDKLSPRYQTFSAMEKKIFSPAGQGGIFCVSNRQKRTFQRIYNTSESRMILLPPGINKTFSKASGLRSKRDVLRDELGIGEEDILLIQVTSAFFSKGVDRSIAALAALPENIRRRTRLLVVGRDNPAAYRKFAFRCGVGRQVIFAGIRNDIAELLTAADLMLHPARSEASGSALLEALACGTPVLCSSNCGFSFLVREAGSPVVPGRFRQKILNRTLMLTLSTPGKLADLQSEAENYGKNSDFYQRYAFVADMVLTGGRQA